MSNDNMSKFSYLNLDRNKLYEKLVIIVRGGGSQKFSKRGAKNLYGKYAALMSCTKIEI